MSEHSQVIAAARQPLLRARRLLCEPTPGNLELCRAELGSAIERAGDFVAAIRAGARGRALLGAAGDLRNEVGAISALLEHAASYHANLLTGMLAVAGLPAAPAAHGGGRVLRV